MNSMKLFNSLQLIALICAILISCNSPNENSAMQKAVEGSSPFERFDFKETDVFVGIDNEEFQLLKMDTLSAGQLLELFEMNYGEKWQKRFSEDFVEYLNRLDIYPNNPESFTLIDSEGNTVVKEIAFDYKKRTKAKAHYRANYKNKIKVDIDKVLSQSEAYEDIEQLKEFIKNKYSYIFLNDVNLDNEINDVKQQINGDVSVYQLALLISKFINKYGDGHSRLENINFKESGALPFSTKPFGEKVLCIKDGKLVNENFPFLHSINGANTADLLQVSEEYLTPDASPQFKKMVRVGRLNRIGTILNILEKYDDQLSIKLVSEDGQVFDLKEKIERFKKTNKHIERAKQVNEMRKSFEVKNYGEIGYLKIKKMTPLIPELGIKLPVNQLKKSKAIIIDVRDNGGGARDVLMNLAPHFISEKQKFVIGNVSRLRTDTPSKNYSLRDRYLYQSDDKYFDVPTQERINTWANNFAESVKLDDNLYTPNYYLYIEKAENPLFAETPTIVLLNEGCFSATDIFLSTFKEIDDVTLIGTPSGGGSGRLQRYVLSNSFIEINLSSMASFQPNGQLYDGIGVQPDILVKQKEISDYLGQTDTQLGFAINYLRRL